MMRTTFHRLLPAILLSTALQAHAEDTLTLDGATIVGNRELP